MHAPILVTGGLGMLGGYVCRALLAAGRQPVIVDLRADASRIADISDDCIVEAADICDLPGLQTLVEKYRPDAIVHLGGLIGPAVNASPSKAFQVNLGGNVTVLECARLANVPRVVTISSKMVYGPVDQIHRHPAYVPVNESHPREPQDLYGKLKRAVEDMADHYARAYGIDVIAMRFGSLYAPGKASVNPSANPIMNLIEAARSGQSLHLPKGAEQKDGLCYAADAAAAILCALTRPRPVDSVGLRAYNIASDVVSLQEIMSALKRLFPGADLGAGPGLSYRGPRYDAHSFAMDIAKSRAELGYQPAWPFEAAAADYCATMNRLQNADARPVAATRSLGNTIS